MTSVELPARGFAANYTYLKIRDRLSYAFALVSVAVGLELEGGTIKQARSSMANVSSCSTGAPACPGCSKATPRRRWAPS